MEISASFSEAFGLISHADPAFLAIVGLSLRVTLTAVALAALVGLPLGAWLALARFPGRSVIVVDDGIATGSTMIAALKLLRDEGPVELLAAAPVGAPRRLEALKEYCDEVSCPNPSDDFFSIGEFYEDFSPVEDEEVVSILADCFRRQRASVGA